MLVTLDVRIEIDTTKSKLVILAIDGETKRIVLSPYSRGSGSTFTVVNDRPDKTLHSALDMIRFLGQRLINRKHVKQLAKGCENKGPL